MKKIEMRHKKYFGIKRFKRKEKRVITFLKKFDLEKAVLYKATIEPDSTKFLFSFIGPKGYRSIEFIYRKNKEVDEIATWGHRIEFGEIKGEKNYELISFLWNQFVEHFNLRIRLLFIDETTPWKWETEFSY